MNTAIQITNDASFYPWLDELRISHSSLSLFHSCAQKFEFAKMLGLPRGDDSFDGDVGKAMHESYQTFLTTQDTDAALFELMYQYPYHLMDEDPTKANNKSLEACYATMNQVFTHAGLAHYEIASINVNGEERPAIEVPFEIEIKGFTLDENKPIRIFYIGFIDAVLFDYVSLSYKVTDLKTHRDNSDDLTAKYMNSDQVIPYGFVIQQLIDPDITAFDASYISAFIDIVNPKVRVYDFPKYLIDIENWARGLYIDLQQIKTFYNLGWWKKDGNSCMSFRRPCKYLDECQLTNPGDKRQQFLLGPDKGRNVEPWVKIQLELAA